jgi:predicted nucleotide-binding protein/predicted ester cyclase
MMTVAGGAASGLPARAQDATPAAADCLATTPDENKALVEGYWDAVYNQKNPLGAEAFLAEDFTRYNLSRPQANEPGNADDVRRAEENLQDFPDLQTTVEEIIAEGDMVAARITWSGTQRDAIDQWHAPATGNPTTFALMAMYRVECGLLAEQWVVLDYLSMVRELGIVSDDELATIGSAAMATPATPAAPPPVATEPPATPQPAASSRPERPRVFIGSSVEGLPVAEAIQFDLQYFADVTLWDQGVFHLTEATLTALTQAADQSDFAILVLTADDVVTRRGKTIVTARDNVIFELGLFMGWLGPERVFIVYSRDDSPTLPSDLAGVTAATFAERADGNMDAAVGPASIQIKRAMEAVMAAEEE